jgi:NAD(P)H-dependent FMN reductase
MTILGIAGSLRKASFNRGALRAAQHLVPEGVSLEIFDLEGIPPFNQGCRRGYESAHSGTISSARGVGEAS